MIKSLSARFYVYVVYLLTITQARADQTILGIYTSMQKADKLKKEYKDKHPDVILNISKEEVQ